MGVGIPIRWSDNTEELRRHLKEGLDQIVATEAGAKKLMDSLSGERMIMAAHKYAAAISEIGGASKLTTAEATRANAVFDKAIAKYTAMGGALGPIPTDLAKIAAETKAVAVAEKEAAEASEALKKAAKDAADAAAEQTAALARQAKEVEAAQKASQQRMVDALNGVALGAKSAGMALTAGITVPLVAMATAGISASAPFEASLNRMVSLAAVTKDELAGVKEHILALAPAVGIGPQKLAEAMMIVSSTVEDTSTALQILDVAAKGSAAGLGDAFDVARALTAVINSYGAANITAARAADVLVQTVKDGGAEAKELAPVLANVVPIAAQLGISFEEVGANIATVTKLGVPAAEAVTQLSSVFTGLLKETTKGKEALASIGRTYADLRAEVKEKGLMEALIHLNEEFGVHREKLTQVFGRIEALRDIMSTAGQQADTYAEVLKHLNDAAGSLDGAFLQMKGTQVQTWNEVRAALDVVAIRFGDALAPSLIKVLESAKPLLDTVIRLVQAFADLPEPVRETVIAFGGLAAAFGPLLFAFGALVATIRTLVTSWLALEAYFAGGAAVAEGAVVVEGAAVAGEAAATSFGAALVAFASTGVGLAIEALIALGIALYEAYQHFESLRTITNEVAGAIGSTVVAAWKELAEVISDTARIIRDVFIIEWQHLRDEFHLDMLAALARALRDVAEAIGTDLTHSVVTFLAQAPGLKDIVRDLLLLAALKQGLHGTADSLDELASAAQGRLVGAHPVGPQFMALPPSGRGQLRTGPAATPGQDALGGFNADELLAKVKALTAAQRERIAVLKEEGFNELQIAQAMNMTKEVIGVYERGLSNLTKAHHDVVDTSAKLWAEYAQAADKAFGDTLGGQLAAIEKWHQGELETLEKSKQRNAHYWEELDAIEAVYWQKRITAEQANYKKLIQLTIDADNERAQEAYDASVKEAARREELHKKGLTTYLAAERAFQDELAKSTLTEREQKKRAILLEEQDRIAALDFEADNVTETYDDIIKTTRLKMGEIGVIWDSETKEFVDTFDNMWSKGGVEHSMLPPNATFQTKKAILSISDTLGGLAQTFTQLATIGGDSMSVVFKGLAGGAVAAKALVDAITATENALKSIKPISEGITQGASSALSALTITNVALAWVGVGIAIYQVADSLVKAHEAAVEAHAVLVWAQELANNFKNATEFSDQLAASIRKTADSKMVDLATQALFIMHGRDWMGRTEEQWHEALGTALQITDLVKEMGGFANLTAEQLSSVVGSINDLFIAITAGGTMAVKATQQLDDVLSDMGQTAIDAGKLVDQTFLDMVKRAQESGVELKKVTDLLQKQAQSGEDGILAAFKVTDDAYKKRADLQQQIADLTAKQATQTGDAADETAAKIKELNKELETQNQIIQVTGIHSAEIADSMAGGLLSVIDSQVRAGKSFGDAIRAVGPGVQSLETQMANLGLTGGPAFQFLKTQVDLFTDAVAGPALTAMEGWAQGLRGLHNAGLLNQDTFSGLANQIGATHDALIAQGKDPQAVLTAMQGPLQTLWELEQKFGYKTDEATQKLIDQAVANGEVGEQMKPVQEQMLDAMNHVADAVDDLVVALGGVPGASKKAADGLKDNFGKLRIDPVTVPYTFQPTNAPGAPSSPPASGAATGGYVTAFGVQRLAGGGMVFGNLLQQLRGTTTTGTDTVPIMATPGEGIVTTTGMDLLGQAALATLNRGRIPTQLQSPTGLPGDALMPEAFQFLLPRLGADDAHIQPYPYTGLDGEKTISGGSPGWADLARDVSRAGTAVTGGGAVGGEVHYHEWKIAVSALDATDLRHKVEHEILPMVIDELEDNRRSSARRMANALHSAK